MKRRHTVFIVLLLCYVNIAISAEYPDTILIHDYSADTYIGRYEYEYELVLKGEYYELFRSHLLESDRKGDRIRSKRKLLKEVPRNTIGRLLSELENRQDSLGLSDLGFTYNWFYENEEKLYDIAKRQWQERWPDDRDWNAYQIELIKEEVTKGENISRAVQQSFLGAGILVLHSTGSSRLSIELKFDRETIILAASRNYMGLPWVVNDNQEFYNQGISAVINEFLPTNEGFNKRRLTPIDEGEILERIVRRLYDNYCEREVKKLAYHNYQRELNELKDRFELSGIREERSGTYNWSGEDRLFMYARDFAEDRNIYFGISLTYEEETLYTRDSVLKKAAYCRQLVSEVPFLLEYLDENPKRRLEITFDNGASLSKKVKERQTRQITQYSQGSCLTGVSEDFLNGCVYFILRNELGEGSNWLITPYLDVILVYYQYPTVYKYSDADLGLEGPSIRYACQYFDRDGNIRSK